MDEFVDAHRRIVAETTIRNLEKHGFQAKWFPTKTAAAEFIMDAVKDCATIGVAGTHTVRALGIIEPLTEAGKRFVDHWRFQVGTPEELECRKEQTRVDAFLSSSNAITMTGEIVNRDGCGNRINAMTFGPGKVIIVVGRNKLVADLDAAIARIEEVAAPIRAMSLKRKTPCVSTGHCMDCDSPERICRITSIIHRKPIFTHITVVIVDEDMGY
jgi:hypothetical protein